MKDTIHTCETTLIKNLCMCAQGIVTSSIAYYVQGLVIQIRGPVFASAFSPLMMIIVAIMGSFILAEKIYVGG
jgi:drug/metabolite transporter (DMT)-like permease